MVNDGGAAGRWNGGQEGAFWVERAVQKPIKPTRGWDWLLLYPILPPGLNTLHWAA